jgi:acyl carrier protein
MREKIQEIILDSIKEFNKEKVKDEVLEISNDTALLDVNGKLDSLDFITLIVIIEENISDKLGKNITIVSEKAFSKKYSPFKNVNTMTEFIVELLESEK